MFPDVSVILAWIFAAIFRQRMLFSVEKIIINLAAKVLRGFEFFLKMVINRALAYARFILPARP